MATPNSSRIYTCLTDVTEIHGGSLHIESEKSRGTRVVVRLQQAHTVDEIEQHAEEMVMHRSDRSAYRTRDGDPGDRPPSSRTA
jgi:hypothetical protein